MVLPTDKSSKAFNVAVTKLNHKYSGATSSLTKKAIDAKQKMTDLQEDLINVSYDLDTHERVIYYMGLPYMSFN